MADAMDPANRITGAALTCPGIDRADGGGTDPSDDAVNASLRERNKARMLAALDLLEADVIPPGMPPTFR